MSSLVPLHGLFLIKCHIDYCLPVLSRRKKCSYQQTDVNYILTSIFLNSPNTLYISKVVFVRGFDKSLQAIEKNLFTRLWRLLLHSFFQELIVFSFQPPKILLYLIIDSFLAQIQQFQTYLYKSKIAGKFISNIKHML